jgi:hypothetical protein
LPSSSDPEVWSTEGPVQAEVFVVRLCGDSLELAGPCGPDAWYIEVGEDEDPVDVVNRLTNDVVGKPLLVHSTSWRRGRGSVILSFVVVLPDSETGVISGIPVGRAALARSEATAAPVSIANEQVIEHGLRHMAWLVKDDDVVRATLSPGWKTILSDYVPEPFQHLKA